MWLSKECLTSRWLSNRQPLFSYLGISLWTTQPLSKQTFSTWGKGTLWTLLELTIPSAQAWVAEASIWLGTPLLETSVAQLQMQRASSIASIPRLLHPLWTTIPASTLSTSLKTQKILLPWVLPLHPSFHSYTQTDQRVLLSQLVFKHWLFEITTIQWTSQDWTRVFTKSKDFPW